MQELADLQQQVTDLKKAGEKAMQQLQAEQHSKAEVETKLMTVQAQLTSLQQQPQQVSPAPLTQLQNTSPVLSSLMSLIWLPTPGCTISTPHQQYLNVKAGVACDILEKSFETPKEMRKALKKYKNPEID